MAAESLSNEEILRYGRQLIVPGIGREGQERLKNTKVLVVGAGGLGSPSSMYLASAGIGTIGIVDYDSVDETNLQRQIIHDESRVGLSKAQSACAALTKLNRFGTYHAHETLLDSSNALDIISRYDIILDATDNVATRYLLSDACVLLSKPLVSGSALRMEGQLTVYNYHGGPCYRCLFPTPPPAETVTNCADGGVLGAVTGVIGTMQALEAIKIALGKEPAYAQKLLLFDAWDSSFRSVKLRPRDSNCIANGDHPSLTGLIDYVSFCGAGAHDKVQSLHLLTPQEQIQPQEYQRLRQSREPPSILIDVREPVQFGICSLPEAINIPLRRLGQELSRIQEEIDKQQATRIVVVCRRGNDSQEGVLLLRRHGFASAVSITGGLENWTKNVDSNFPVY